MKIYFENQTNSAGIGGGWRFLENLIKVLKDKVEIVEDFKECDIFFVFGITAVDKGRVYEAHNLRKKIVLRLDNCPRMSRNKRQTPYERIREFGKLADLVVYQSNWAKEYTGYFVKNDNEVIINNGVDPSIFNTEGRQSDGKTYLYINYNDNPNKRFDEAIYRFDMEWRQDNEKRLVIAGNVPRIYLEYPEYNWDLTSKAQVDYAGIMNSPEEVANLMKTCDILLYPSAMEAYPNTLLEAMACGLEPKYLNLEGGTIEAYNNSIEAYNNSIIKPEFELGNSPRKIKVKTIQEMGVEYLEQFKQLLK